MIFVKIENLRDKPIYIQGIKLEKEQIFYTSYHSFADIKIRTNPPKKEKKK